MHIEKMFSYTKNYTIKSGLSLTLNSTPQKQPLFLMHLSRDIFHIKHIIYTIYL